MTIDACSTIPEDQAGTSNTRPDDNPEWDDGSSNAQYHVIPTNAEELIKVTFRISGKLVPRQGIRFVLSRHGSSSTVGPMAACVFAGV